MSMAEGSDLGYLSERESRLTRLACPECGGSLAQVDLAEISYFQCHVGHQYAPESLAAAQSESAEAKLWSAVAALEEEAAFQRYLQTQVDHSGSAREEHRRRAEEIAARAGQLRVLVKAWSPLPQQLPQA